MAKKRWEVTQPFTVLMPNTSIGVKTHGDALSIVLRVYDRNGDEVGRREWLPSALNQQVLPPAKYYLPWDGVNSLTGIKEPLIDGRIVVVVNYAVDQERSPIVEMPAADARALEVYELAKNATLYCSPSLLEQRFVRAINRRPVMPPSVTYISSRYPFSRVVVQYYDASGQLVYQDSLLSSGAVFPSDYVAKHVWDGRNQLGERVARDRVFFVSAWVCVPPPYNQDARSEGSVGVRSYSNADDAGTPGFELIPTSQVPAAGSSSAAWLTWAIPIGLLLLESRS